MSHRWNSTSSGGDGADARDGLQQRHRLTEREEAALDFLLDLGDGRRQVVDVAEQLDEEEALVRLDPAFQRLPQLRELLAQAGPRELREGGVQLVDRRAADAVLEEVEPALPDRGTAPLGLGRAARDERVEVVDQLLGRAVGHDGEVAQEGGDADAEGGQGGVDGAAQHGRRAGAGPDRADVPPIGPRLSGHPAADIGQVGGPAPVGPAVRVAARLPPTVDVEGDHRQPRFRPAGAEFGGEGVRLPVARAAEADDEGRPSGRYTVPTFRSPLTNWNPA